MARENWGSRTGFILAAAGSAVGVGNIWRFPALVGQNGGSAFVLVYIGLAVIVGASLLLAEIAIGRLAQRGPVGAFVRLKGGPWSFVGGIAVLASFLVLSFYAVVGGWIVAYIVKIAFGSMIAPGANFGEVFAGVVGKTGAPIAYQGFFLAVVVAVVVGGIGKGIELASKLLMPVLFLLLLFLVASAVMLPGAMPGVEFYLYPDFSKLNGAAFLAALSQVFFSLSLGMGVMITYGSYVTRTEKLHTSAAWVVFIDVMVAFLAGLMIFPAASSLGVETGEGAGLAFITLPALFAQMPFGAALALAFFVLLLIAALTSAISLLEVCTSFMMDQVRWSRKNATIGIAVLCFLAGIPSSLSQGAWSSTLFFGLGFMDLIDALTAKIMLPLGGLAVTAFAGWLLWPQIRDEVSKPAAMPPALRWAWMATLKIVAPLAIVWIMAAGLL